jgi:hypothetical protein
VTIDPANLTAQLHYRAAGNPPSTLADSAISNAFPGLEFDFRNVWRRLFEGIEMHEADNFVLDGDGDLKRLVGRRLLLVEDVPTVVRLVGPTLPSGGDGPLTSTGNPDGVWTMEWSNSMASIVREQVGREVTCWFTKGESKLPAGIPTVDGDPAKVDYSKLEGVKLVVRPLFGTSDGDRPLAVIDESRVQPGELTQSLCSPWQNDYRECACYYWAAARPDYVNVEVDDKGTSVGNMWMAKRREPRVYVPDNRTDSRLWSYDDLFQDWQGRLKFIVGGEDHD